MTTSSSSPKAAQNYDTSTYSNATSTITAIRKIVSEKDANPKATLSCMLPLLNGQFRKVVQQTDGLLKMVEVFKGETEKQQLKLQNLRYEKEYLTKEIQRCHSYASKELDKIDFEGPPFVISGNHKDNLQRLQDELKHRKEMKHAIQGMNIRKKTVQEQTQSKQHVLKGLPKILHKLEKVAAPLVQATHPLTEKTAQDDLALTLPAPLYTLYCQVEAYLTVHGTGEDSIDITDTTSFIPTASMLGLQKRKRSEEEEEKGTMALTLASEQIQAHRPSKRLAVPSISSTQSSPERSTLNEMTKGQSLTPVTTTLVTVASKSPFISASTTRMTMDGMHMSQQGITLTLSVTPSKCDTNNSTSVVPCRVEFCYFPQLKLVGVASHPPGLLTCLFPTDTGHSSPNAVLAYTSEAFDYPLNHLFRPYRWAQEMAGLYFLPTQGHETKMQMPMQIQMDGVVEDGGAIVASPPMIIRRVMSTLVARLNAQHSLQSQLTALLSSTPSSTKSVTTIESFQKNTAAVGLLPDHTQYTMLFTHKQDQIAGSVTISPEYPIRPPRFVFHVPGIETYDSQLKDVETELNAHYDELIDEAHEEDHLLTLQIQKALMCFDVLYSKEEEFSGKTRRGKDRRLAIVSNGNNACVHR